MPRADEQEDASVSGSGQCFCVREFLLVFPGDVTDLGLRTLIQVPPNLQPPFSSPQLVSDTCAPSSLGVPAALAQQGSLVPSTLAMTLPVYWGWTGLSAPPLGTPHCRSAYIDSSAYSSILPVCTRDPDP